MSEKRDNSGILFRNIRKEPGSRQSDYNGNATIGGVEYWMDAWLKEGAKGKFFSFSFKPKEPKPELPQERIDLDDEIPF